jgi:tRNA pseudouridine38-40 synthase
MVPSYMLCSQDEVKAAFDSAKKDMRDEAKDKLTPMEASNIVSEAITQEVLDQARAKLGGYRTTADQIDRLRDALKVFEGTHTFHNYTRRLAPNDPSASRYIMSFVPLDPVIVPGSINDHGIKCEDSEWIPVQVRKSCWYIPLNVQHRRTQSSSMRL